MDDLGIDSVDIGLPGAGPHVVEAVTRLAREIVDCGLKMRPNCAARTIAADIVPIIEISQKVGIPIEVACFIGSSPIRQYAEDWDLDRMLRLSEDAVSLAVKEGLPVMYVTEDTTRAHPDDIRRMYTTAIRAGAQRVCVCDTVGPRDAQRRAESDHASCRISSRSSTRTSRSTGTGIRTAAWESPTPSGRSRRARTASTPAPSGSASASGIRRWTSSSSTCSCSGGSTGT